MSAVPLSKYAIHLRPADNIAVAAKVIPAGTQLAHGSGTITLPAVILIALSVVALAMSLYKIIQFAIVRVGRHKPALFAMDKWFDGDRDDAYEHIMNHRAPLSRVMAHAMRGVRCRRGAGCQRCGGVGEAGRVHLPIFGDVLNRCGPCHRCQWKSRLLLTSPCSSAEWSTSRWAIRWRTAP